MACFVRRGLCAGASNEGASHRRPSAIIFKCPDRKALLLGTALASTLVIGALTAPVPATAQVTCPQGTPPDPIEFLDPGNSIECVNEDDRNNGTNFASINLTTDSTNEFIFLDNSGKLTVTNDVGGR